MNVSGKKRTSKWDLKEAPQSPIEPGNLPVSFHDEVTDRRSPGVSGTNDSKWSLMEANNMLNHYSGVPPRDPLPGGRVPLKDDTVNRDFREFSKATSEWDGDGSYGMKMSPGLEEWRRQSRSRSPRKRWSRSRSRSRSRSPAYGFKRESGLNERSRSRSGLSAQLCKDFSAGRCRKGNDCHFVHHGNENYENRRYTEGDNYESRARKDGAPKYLNNNDATEPPSRAGRSTDCCVDFLKGKCRKGASCRYPHHRTSDGGGLGPADELIREREDDRRPRGSSFEHGSDREPRRKGDIPCKFFAAGNCRNGKSCRFSHYLQANSSADGRSRDDRWGKDHNLVNADKYREVSKWNDTALTNGGERRRKLGASEPRTSLWSKDDGMDNSLDYGNKSLGGPESLDKAVGSEAKESFQLKRENNDSIMAFTESTGTHTWLGDMEMSPEWNYGVKSTNHVNKEEPGYMTRSSQSLNHNHTTLPSSSENITHEASGQIHHAAGVMQPIMFEKSHVQQKPRSDDGIIGFSYNGRNAIGNSSSSHIDLNFTTNNLPGQSFGQNSSVVPLLNTNVVVQSQQAFTSDLPSGGSSGNPQNMAIFPDGNNKPDKNALQITSDIPSMQNTVSSEQLAQLTNISASLAQLFSNQQQLPQLYAALNSPKILELVPTAEPVALAPVTAAFTQPKPAIMPAAFTQPKPAIMPQKQYDPMCDSMEQIKPNVTYHSPIFSPNSVGQKIIADGKPDIPSKYLSPLSIARGPNGGSFYRTGSSGEDHNENHQFKQPVEAATCEAKEIIEMGPEESKKAEDETKKPGENSPIENMDTEGGPDEGKKSKDVKVVRAFKFALVEFVKELLKPSWKEGQINKEAYKTIVKKVADKVTGTIQGAHIPQTQEKIDQYLSFSKPKLNKLVQAYVEKHQKS